MIAVINNIQKKVIVNNIIKDLKSMENTTFFQDTDEFCSNSEELRIVIERNL